MFVLAVTHHSTIYRICVYRLSSGSHLYKIVTIYLSACKFVVTCMHLYNEIRFKPNFIKKDCAPKRISHDKKPVEGTPRLRPTLIHTEVFPNSNPWSLYDIGQITCIFAFALSWPSFVCLVLNDASTLVGHKRQTVLN